MTSSSPQMWTRCSMICKSDHKDSYVPKVLSREALHKLRWCETTHPVLSGALWMPLGRFSTVHFFNCLVFPPTYLYYTDQLCVYIEKNLSRFDLALRTDRPVVGRPHTWALPTIYRFDFPLLQCPQFVNNIAVCNLFYPI